MEQIAIISDVHGNMPAFEVVLEDIERRGITRILCLGDLIGKGPHGDRVVDICRARCDSVVRGNWDEFIVTDSDPGETVTWNRDRLGPDRLAYLAALPFNMDFVISGRHIRLVHASPQGVYNRVRQADPLEKLNSMFERTDSTDHGFTPDVVGYGDIHTAFVRSFQLKMLFNVGSVGNPLDLPLACYAILEGTSNTPTLAPFSINIIRLPYDIDLAIQQAAAEGMPQLTEYANELRTARYRGLPT